MWDREKIEKLMDEVGVMEGRPSASEGVPTVVEVFVPSESCGGYLATVPRGAAIVGIPHSGDPDSALISADGPSARTPKGPRTFADRALVAVGPIYESIMSRKSLWRVAPRRNLVAVGSFDVPELRISLDASHEAALSVWLGSESGRVPPGELMVTREFLTESADQL